MNLLPTRRLLAASAFTSVAAAAVVLTAASSGPAAPSTPATGPMSPAAVSVATPPANPAQPTITAVTYAPLPSSNLPALTAKTTSTRFSSYYPLSTLAATVTGTGTPGADVDIACSGNFARSPLADPFAGNEFGFTPTIVPVAGDGSWSAQLTVDPAAAADAAVTAPSLSSAERRAPYLLPSRSRMPPWLTRRPAAG